MAVQGLLQRLDDLHVFAEGEQSLQGGFDLVFYLFDFIARKPLEVALQFLVQPVDLSDPV